VRQTIDFFNQRSSNVYIAPLDASKAFDRINHFKLFSAHIKKGLPMMFTNVICNWYNKLFIDVRWNGQNSSSIPITSGVRQGGVLSPFLLNIYVDCLMSGLVGHEIGMKSNCSKCKCIVIGQKKIDRMGVLTLDNVKLQWIINIKYLGICITAGKVFKADITDTRRILFSAVN